MAAKEKVQKEMPTELNKEDCSAAIDLAIGQIDKSFGKGTIMSGTQYFPDLQWIPSGSLKLDKALGGGYAKGRIVEILGPESSGKTTLALHAVAEAQKKFGACAYIDMEHALDINYAGDLGVDTETLLIAQPSSGEQALNIAESLVRTGAVNLIVVDSVAALIPEKELEGEMGDSNMGLQARLMSQAMRKLSGIASTSKTCIIFINQIRMKIGVMFGNPETTTGGNALKFYASQRLDVRRIATLGTDEEKTGITSRVKIIKNKVGKPFREAEFGIIFGEGIDSFTELVELASEKGVLVKGGAWYNYGDVKLQGMTNVKNWLNENPAIYEEIKLKVLND